jgi:hypothetical protein
MIDIRATKVQIAFEFFFWTATIRRIVLPLSFTPDEKALRRPNGNIFNLKELAQEEGTQIVCLKRHCVSAHTGI